LGFAGDPAVCVAIGLGRNVFGHGYACALRSDESLTCWGDGESGQLGGDTDQRAPAPPSLCHEREWQVDASMAAPPGRV